MKSTPEIFNTDQGSQYTSTAFTGELIGHGIRASMDSRGRAFDNIFIERLWRSLKYEEIYLNEYERVKHVAQGISEVLRFLQHPEDPISRLGTKHRMRCTTAGCHRQSISSMCGDGVKARP